MRVAGIAARGAPVEVLEVDELVPPAPDEVLLEVVTAGMGNWDELVRIGSWQLGGPAPMALGTEAAGTVVAVGARVAELREGDEVMTHPLPLRRDGTWAGKLLAPAETVALRPPAASWEASAAFPIPALTSAQALDEVLGIERGGWLLVNGAGGVTGGLLVQLAAARGARVIATASTKKADRIRGYGQRRCSTTTVTGPRSCARSPAAVPPRPSTLLGGRRPRRWRPLLKVAASPRSRATRHGRSAGSSSPTSTSDRTVGSCRAWRRCWHPAPCASRSRPSAHSNRRHKRYAKSSREPTAQLSCHSKPSPAPPHARHAVESPPGAVGEGSVAVVTSMGLGWRGSRVTG